MTTTQNPTTQTLTIVGPNLPDQAKAEFHVHAAGCKDLKRGWLGQAYLRELVHGPSYDIEATCLLDVESTVYYFAPAENEDYTLGDYQGEFHFAPCVHLPLEAPHPEPTVIEFAEPVGPTMGPDGYWTTPEPTPVREVTEHDLNEAWGV